MKCAASAETARSACWKVSRFGARPVTRSLLTGSISAVSSGCRARTRRNSPSRCGDGLFWMTASLCLRFRSLPPRLREVSHHGGGYRPFYPIPARNPLLCDVKYGNCIETRYQGAVERPHRRNEVRALPGRQQGGNHRVHCLALGAHIVPRPRTVGRGTSPVEPLLIARRQRLVPAVRDHVEIIVEPALVKLDRIDRLHRRLDAGAFQIAGIGQRDAFLIARRDQDFEGKRGFGQTLPQYGVV